MKNIKHLEPLHCPYCKRSKGIVCADDKTNTLWVLCRKCRVEVGNYTPDPKPTSYDEWTLASNEAVSRWNKWVEGETIKD